MTKFSISSKPLDCGALARTVQDDYAGAFASFEGWVRNHNEGHHVNALEYEVFHQLALSEGLKIIDEAIDKFSLTGARAVHREGMLAIGDCAIWIGVSAPHRAEAFDACRYIIDELKHRLPVWKKEHYADIEPQWVNCRHHHTPPPDIRAQDYYARQIKLSEIGESGQQKLDDSKILVIGAGGLGSSALLALAGAGIGTIGIADHDHLSVSNLHRQILYGVDDIGKPKADLAAARLKALNPLININIYREKINADNALSLFGEFDIVLDCTDNFTAKYLLNDAAVLTKTPLVQASIYQFEGQLLTIDPESESGCLRCLFPQAPAAGMVGDCGEAGVLGTVPILFGTMQANEAIKKILGIGGDHSFTLFDMLSLKSRNLPRIRDVDCAVCGQAPTIVDLVPEPEYMPDPAETITSLKSKFTLIDVRESDELKEKPVSGAFHVPLSGFDPNSIPADRDKPLLVICAHGVRSQQAARLLREAGWENVFNLSGGLAGGAAVFNKTSEESAA